jgi:XTP/dITP diphosphohydrolase
MNTNLQPLLIGTRNPGKLSELRALLADLPIQLVDLDSIGLDLNVEETGGEYAANAIAKATAFAQASGLWTLADDSGLEVDALDGAPGVSSARLAGPCSSDAERRQVLLRLLTPFPRPWIAHFRCTMALASSHDEIDLTVGSCHGELIPQERGTHGFGYDPIFLLPDLNRTLAELTMEEKNRLSHRAQALRAILPTLRQRLNLSQFTMARLNISTETAIHTRDSELIPIERGCYSSTSIGGRSPKTSLHEMIDFTCHFLRTLQHDHVTCGIDHDQFGAIDHLRHELAIFYWCQAIIPSTQDKGRRSNMYQIRQLIESITRQEIMIQD